ncbi:MAG TPA: hypothetical protein VGK29_18615 [Paludibaculum sp.]|jgi:hypothetical protein
MPFTLRDAWTTLVSAEDYEQHMAAIGQAQTNATHIRDFLALVKPPAGARLLIAGAGPGQMFDHIEPAVLQPYRIIFSDINPRFLVRLRERYGAALCVVDDIERTSLTGPFEAVMETLMLEHVEWRKAVAALCGLGAEYLYLVVQQNPPDMATAVTPTRTPPGTMRIFAQAHPRLLDIAELTSALHEAGYTIISTHPRAVADGKTMLGLLARRV